MRTRGLDKINRLIRQVEERIGKTAMTELPSALAEYSQTGQLPDNRILRAYIGLVDAFSELTSASVPASDNVTESQKRYEEAVKNYTEAEENYRVLTQKNGVKI